MGVLKSERRGSAFQMITPGLVDAPGIRVTNGRSSRVVNMVLKEGTILAIGGTVIGLAGAYLVGRAMQSTLYGVEALDVRSFAAVSVLLLAAALLASLIPALRAGRVEPLVALRHD